MLFLSPNLTTPIRASINERGLNEESGVGPGEGTFKMGFQTQNQGWGFRVSDRIHSNSELEGPWGVQVETELWLVVFSFLLL